MKSTSYRRYFCFALIFIAGIFCCPSANAYSVLTHQAVIDASWEEGLKPLLLHRYPKATKEELRKAHAYAYGGAIIQDMGYVPFGNKFFTDLVHYMRTGDFVENLIASSENMNELAFSLGALAHYNADIYGHPIGTNRAVPLIYPKVKSEFGDTVTYADDPVSHVKTEFGFDVLQVARGNYAPEAYQDFIGFEVASEVLERAFKETYGLELKKVFVSLPLAIGSYRYTIRGLMPDLTRAAWQAKKNDIRQATPSITKQKFVYRMRRAKYHEQWGRDYERPNLFTRLTASIIKVLPKIGPLRPLALVPPTPEAEKYFMESFNATVEGYSAMLHQMKKKDKPNLHNPLLDTGQPVISGKYNLADETYAKLLSKLADDDFEQIPLKLREDILAFFKHAEPKHDKDWEKTMEALAKLQQKQLVIE